MAEYKIAKVSANAPRAWSFNDKKTGMPVAMETYKVMLEGVDEPVELNRKAGSVPMFGDTLTGTITRDEYGQKFKAERKPFTPGASFAPKDQESIKAQWAIGQATSIEIASISQTQYFDFTRVEENAKKFFKMIERVKAPDSGYDKFKEQGEKLKQTVAETFSDGSPVTDMDMSEPVNLDDIPF